MTTRILQDSHVDYSHGIRLISQQILADGHLMQVRDVLRDKELSVLISSEGPIETGYRMIELP